MSTKDSKVAHFWKVGKAPGEIVDAYDKHVGFADGPEWARAIVDKHNNAVQITVREQVNHKCKCKT